MPQRKLANGYLQWTSGRRCHSHVVMCSKTSLPDLNSASVADNQVRGREQLERFLRHCGSGGQPATAQREHMAQLYKANPFFATQCEEIGVHETSISK